MAQSRYQQTTKGKHPNLLAPPRNRWLLTRLFNQEAMRQDAPLRLTVSRRGG